MVLCRYPLLALFLFQLTHALSRTAFKNKAQPLRARFNTQKCGYTCKSLRRVLDHILVPKEQEIRVSSPGTEPSPHVLTPAAPIGGTKPAVNEILYVFFQRVQIIDMPILPFKIVVRQDHVSGIANDVDHALVTVIKVFVTLDESRPWDPFQGPTGLCLCIRHQSLDVGKGGGLFLVKQIRDKKPRPSISGTWIGHNKRIVRVNREVTSRDIFAQSIINDKFDPVDRGGLPRCVSSYLSL